MNPIENRQTVTIRPTQDDKRIISALMKHFGVDPSQIFRLGIRALAKKEGVKVN